MARKQPRQPNEPSEPLRLTCSYEDASRKISEQIEKGNRLRDKAIQNLDQFQEREQAYFRWDDYNTTLLKSLFNRPDIIDQYRDIAWIGGVRTTLGEKVVDLRDDLNRKLNRLRSILEQLDLFQVQASATQGNSGRSNMVPSSKALDDTIFIVHGHNDGLKSQVARFLERLGLKAVILQEQPDGGRTIIEKFEHYASTCGFAVILLTADDVGYSNDSPDKASPRARQNVILELGYFLAKLGRERVCALVEKGVELPSDYHGMLWKALDDSSWEYQLAKEIKAAGLPVDLNKL